MSHCLRYLFLNQSKPVSRFVKIKTNKFELRLLIDNILLLLSFKLMKNQDDVRISLSKAKEAKKIILRWIFSLVSCGRTTTQDMSRHFDFAS